MRKLLCLMGGVMLLFHLHAQQIRPLEIGDHISNLKVSGIVNYSRPADDLIRFNDKLLIIDFITTRCSGCIAALPRMDSIAIKNEQKLAIFVSTPENTNRVNNFLTSTSIGKSLSLPFITNDSLLESYFPHTFISHVAWIFKGKVVAITHSDYVTENNINTVLSGQKIKWPVKRDVVNYDYNSGILKLNKENIPPYSRPKNFTYSAFFSHMDNIPSRYKICFDSTANLTRVTATNLSILQLYLKAFNLSPTFEYSHIVTSKSLVEKMVNSGDLENTKWREKNTQSYETVMKGHPSALEIGEKLRKDFNKHFNLTSYIKDTMVDCWKLVYDPSLQTEEFSKFDNHAAAIKAQTIDIRGIIYKMNHTFFHPPVIGLNGFGTKKYMRIKYYDDHNDFSQINNSLASYGFFFKKIRTSLPVLVIKQLTQ